MNYLHLFFVQVCLSCAYKSQDSLLFVVFTGYYIKLSLIFTNIYQLNE